MQDGKLGYGSDYLFSHLQRLLPLKCLELFMSPPMQDLQLGQTRLKQLCHFDCWCPMDLQMPQDGSSVI